MHLLTTRFAAGPNYPSWFDGCPLIVAASKNSVPMTRLLLELGYDASISFSTAARNLSGIGVTGSHNEVNRALLETIYRMSEEEEDNIGNSDNTLEIIRLLISQGGANPHLPVTIRIHGKPRTQGDKTMLLSYLKGKMTQEDIPLSAAARAANAEAVKCMLYSYSSALGECKILRRNDPLLRPQPESYFRLLEERG